MHAYVYQAALYCEDCTEKLKEFRSIAAQSASEFSDDYPQGPYANGGGEAEPRPARSAKMSMPAGDLDELRDPSNPGDQRIVPLLEQSLVRFGTRWSYP